MLTTSHWPLVRAAVEETATRFSTLLRSVADPHARAIGDWTVGDTAAHVLEVSLFNSAWATGRECPATLRDLHRTAAHGGIAAIAQVNREAVERVPDRDPHVLAARIEDEIGDLLATTASLPGDEPVSWIGGMKITRTAVLGHMLSEFLLHGHDIARAERRRFPIPAPHAALYFETLLTEVVQNADLEVIGVGPVTWEVRLRGAGSTVFAFDGERLSTTDDGTNRIDLHMSVDPAIMLLVMYRRISPLLPSLTGRIVMWGRRPWRLGRLVRVMQMP